MVSITTSGPIVALTSPFEDTRGYIQTLVDGGVHSVQIITSNAFTVRANHYHKQDSHYMYVISGRMRYLYRPVGSSEAPLWLNVEQGQLVFTPPMVEHAVEFLEDTILINITSQPRGQTDYESDIVKVDLYKPFVS